MKSLWLILIPIVQMVSGVVYIETGWTITKILFFGSAAVLAAISLYNLKKETHDDDDEFEECFTSKERW